MKENQIQKWAVTRQMGAWRYGLTYGTIWGFFVASFVFLANYFTDFNKEMSNLKGILLMLAIYWITGIILYRFIFWSAKERAYQAWKKNQKN